MFDPHDPHDRAMQERDDRDATYHEGLDALDRLNTQGPHPSTAAGASHTRRPDLPASPVQTPAAVDNPYVQRPTSRERDEARRARADERAAATRLYPRLRLVEVAPQTCPIKRGPGTTDPEAA